MKTGPAGVRLVEIAMFLTCAVVPCMAGEVTIEDRDLLVKCTAPSGRLSVFDKRTGRTWRSTAATGQTIAGLSKSDPRRLDFRMTAKGLELKCSLRLEGKAALCLRMAAGDPKAVFGGANVPFALGRGLEKGKLLFCNRSCGVYVDVDDRVYGGRELTVYGNTGGLDMPWVGVIDERKGDGYVLLFETPWDAAVRFERGKDRKCRPRARWLPTLGCFGYERRLSYRFSSSGSYVALAKAYREFARSQGKLKTLKEKAAERPVVNRLAGAPLIWAGGGRTAGDLFDFIAEARLRGGITRGILGNAHHGLDHKRHVSFEPLNRLGYVTSEYDSPCGITQGKTGFHSDDVAERAYVHRPGGTPAPGWRTLSGKQFYNRSSFYWAEALATYVPGRVKKHGYNGRFLDVAAALSLYEDHHPKHTFGRRKDMLQRRESLAYLGKLGLLVGTEHMKDWAVDLADYSEGHVSGPFWWQSAVKDGSGWNAGHTRNATRRSDMNRRYLEYGMGIGRRIPLCELVYHDCVVTSWYWGDCAGMFFKVAPELSDRKDLFSMLYGTLPVLWRSPGKGYDWKSPGERARFVRTFADTCKLHEKVFGAEMLSHRFLTSDCTVQKTVFSSGVTCIVNFGETPWKTRIDGKDHTLAPRGFLITGPGFLQSRLVEKGAVVRRIETDGYRLVECAERREFGPVTCKGRFTAFKDGDKWFLVLEGDGEFRVDLRALTGAEDAAFRSHRVRPGKTGVELFGPGLEGADLRVSPRNGCAIVMAEVGR